MHRQHWPGQRNPLATLARVWTESAHCLPTVATAAFCAVISVTATSRAVPPEFPPLGTASSVRGELVSANFIHRTGELRTPAGKLMSFAMPPYAIMTYEGVPADLRDVPLGTEMEFLFLPDEDGALTQLVATRHGQAPSPEGRQEFIAFTKARGVAGWINHTAGKMLTVTFFSGAPQDFVATWGKEFSAGQDVRVCVANDELRTWNPTSTAERGKILKAETVPVTGYGCSGWRVVVEVGHVLEGFRQGRVVRIFGPGWKVQTQIFRECLINYGYQSPRGPHHDPDFNENKAKHYPEKYPYRTDYSNRHLPWFQPIEGKPLPVYSEHRMLGELMSVDAETRSGEFKTERTGEVVKFTMLSVDRRTPVVRYQPISQEKKKRPRLEDLPLGQRYRFHMYQDVSGEFTRCTYISDEASQLVLNRFNYQIKGLDLSRGRIAVFWQGVLVQNYQKELVSPPPYGHSLLSVTTQTRVWKGQTSAKLGDLSNGDTLRVNVTSEPPGKPSRCTDIWIVE